MSIFYMHMSHSFGYFTTSFRNVQLHLLVYWELDGYMSNPS